MQIPIILFFRSGSALLTENIIPEGIAVVNYFFYFFCKSFRVSSSPAFRCKFFVWMLDTCPGSEYSYTIIAQGVPALSAPRPESQKKEGF